MIHESSTASLRAWIEVDLGALLRNAQSLRKRAGVPLIPMVKADAYGLGAVPVTRALQAVGPWGFGVATVPEGEELRAAGITERIVVFTPLLPSEFAAARAARLTPTLGEPRTLAEWLRGGGEWQLAIDTGMQRAGIRWDRVGDIASLVRAAPPAGAFTHYHSPERDDGSIAEQDRRFEAALAGLPVRPALSHTDNSAAVVRRERQPHDLIRPGVFLYGVGSGSHVLAPEPVASLRARILEIHDVATNESVSYGATWRASKPSRVATVAAGYADGYRRHLSNAGRGLLHGKEVHVAGVVTMDMTLFDVTDVSCGPGDVVTLVGRDRDGLLTVEGIAKDAGVSPYELLTGFRQRLPRLYVPPGDVSPL